MPPLLLLLSFHPAAAAAILPSAVPRSILFRRHRFRRPSSSSSSSAIAAARRAPSPYRHFMVEYLVKSCGFTPGEASKACKPLAHLQSTEKPDAALTFMRSQGFHGSRLRRIISRQPIFLCWDVETKLAPKFRFLRDMGFSDSDLVDVILSNPSIIALDVQSSLLPTLKVWVNLFGSSEVLFKHIRINKKRRFLGYSIENRILPNLLFLRDECGIPEERVSLIVRKHPDFIVQKLGSLRALLARAEELGMPRQSMLLLWALNVLYLVSEEKVEAKMKLMKSLGWSESDFSAAFRKAPKFLCFSEKELLRKMEFFVKEVGYTPSYIAHRPTLLLFSLEKRVIPRFRVMEILKSKGLWTARCTLLSVVALSDTKFIDRFVLPNKGKVTEILDILGDGKMR